MVTHGSSCAAQAASTSVLSVARQFTSSTPIVETGTAAVWHRALRSTRQVAFSGVGATATAVLIALCLPLRIPPSWRNLRTQASQAPETTPHLAASEVISTSTRTARSAGYCRADSRLQASGEFADPVRRPTGRIVSWAAVKPQAWLAVNSRSARLVP